MKKIISQFLVLSILPVLAVPLNASTADNRGAEISAVIQPTYMVTIPADTTVQFNQEKTDFGSVTLKQAQLEPNKCVKVTLISDNKLKHETDQTQTLAYTINEKTQSANAFTSAEYLNAGDKTDLTIGITKDDWEKAYAGSYSNTVTFKIEYTNPSS